MLTPLLPKGLLLCYVEVPTDDHIGRSIDLQEEEEENEAILPDWTSVNRWPITQMAYQRWIPSSSRE